MTRQRLARLFAGCLALSACDRSLWVETPMPEVTTVCLIDVSGSMRPALRQAAREVCVREIDSAPPGQVIVRILDGASAVNEAEVSRVTVPSDGSCKNPFAPTCFEEQQSRDAQLARVRAEAITRVRSIPSRLNGSTDLVGALVAAGATLAPGSEQLERVRRLIVVSDLEDTAGRSAELTGLLTGVEVVAFLQTAPDPALSRRRSDEFARLCAEAGATSVLIAPLIPTGS